MSTPRVFLHVGSPKTGTTFLQNVLWQQRDLAVEQGLTLPGKRFADHYLATLDVRDIADDPNHPADALGSWDRLVTEAHAASGNVLISHELFAGATADQAARAVKALEGTELHLVLTARDLVRQFSAEWQEHVKHRSTESFGDFIAGVRADTGRRSWFWQVQDYAGVIKRWGARLPGDRIHVVTVPPSGAAPEVLWQRFAQVLDLEPGSFHTDLPRSNTSLGLEQAELLRRVNAALGERLPIPGPYPGVVKNVLAHRILESRSGTKLALSQADAEFATEQSRALADRLAASGVDVIGDLADLVPDEAALAQVVGGTEYAPPSDAELLAESIGAIADLLEVMAEQRRAQSRAEELASTAREKPVRFAVVQASRDRAVVRKALDAYRSGRSRLRGEDAE